jgi:hypothetical protein
MEPITAQGGHDPTPAALPWEATRGRAPLAERIRFNIIGYYKGGLQPTASIRKKSKQFFFEKKYQKTFATIALPLSKRTSSKPNP